MSMHTKHKMTTYLLYLFSGLLGFIMPHTSIAFVCAIIFIILMSIIVSAVNEIEEKLNIIRFVYNDGELKCSE